MADLFSKIIGTILLRPYVFVFLLIYLLASFSQMGWKKSLAFLVAGYLIAFFSELSSIHSGFPYGLYHYIPETVDKELWIAGVPFMDSLSYVFLAYCSFSMALFILSPIYKLGCEIFILDSHLVRNSWRTLFLGAFLMMFLDIIIDPVALRGSRWFLGQIYYYPEPGKYFGVPLANFIGWFIVGGVMIFVLQKISLWKLETDGFDRKFFRMPWGSFLGVGLYLGVMLFNILVSYFVEDMTLALVNTFYALLFLLLCWNFAWYKLKKVIREDLDYHLKDCPLGRLAYLLENDA